MPDSRQTPLTPEEFKQLTLPLRRLKVSLVWQTTLRERQIAESVRFTAAQYGSPVPKIAEAILNEPEGGSGIVYRTLSLELGVLGEKYPYSDCLRGEASIHFGLRWRVESPRAVVFKDRDDRPGIEREIGSFEGRRILDIEAVGRLPDLIVGFSKRRWIQSLDTLWSIGLPDRTIICSRSGQLVRCSA